MQERLDLVLDILEYFASDKIDSFPANITVDDLVKEFSESEDTIKYHLINCNSAGLLEVDYNKFNNDGKLNIMVHRVNAITGKGNNILGYSKTEYWEKAKNRLDGINLEPTIENMSLMVKELVENAIKNT